MFAHFVWFCCSMPQICDEKQFINLDLEFLWLNQDSKVHGHLFKSFVKGLLSNFKEMRNLNPEDQ